MCSYKIDIAGKVFPLIIQPCTCIAKIKTDNLFRNVHSSLLIKCNMILHEQAVNGPC